MRAGLLLGLGSTGLGRRWEGWAVESHNVRGIFDVKGVDATSGARYALLVILQDVPLHASVQDGAAGMQRHLG